MRRALSIWAAIMSLAAPAKLSAQAGDQPSLVLSLFAGLRTGRQIWTLSDQPFLVRTLLGPNPGQYDTLDLQQQVTSGFVVGAEGTYFLARHVGIEGEIAFLGMALESRCAIRLYQPPQAGDLGPELCNSLLGQSKTTSAVSFSAGLIARLAPSKPTNPYLRVTAGLVTRTRGTVEMVGTFVDRDGTPTQTVVVADAAPTKTSAHLTIGTGVAFALGSGYGLRLDARDIVTPLDRVTGRADPTTGTLSPPHSGKIYHNFAFAVAFDVNLEKRRGRRY